MRISILTRVSYSFEALPQIIMEKDKQGGLGMDMVNIKRTRKEDRN